MRPLLLILLLSCLRVSYAQVTMYGTTAAGGANGFGVLFSVSSAGSYQVLYPFAGGTDGANPYASVVMGAGPKLYGTTRNGGASGNGTIFSYDTLTHTYLKAADFTGSNGAHPDGDLIFFNNKFYGLAPFGGATGNGTIFSYDPSTGVLSDVYDLTIATGTHPHGKLTVYHNQLYLVNTLGGASGGGTIAVYDPVTGLCTAVYNFSSKGTPHSGLVVIDSLLYGTNIGAGSVGSIYFGSIYSFNPASGTYTDLYFPNFYYDGAYPNDLTVKNGILYGTMQQGDQYGGGGTLFSFDPVAKTFKEEWGFINIYRPSDAFEPVSPPTSVPDGSWWGTTTGGGSVSAGAIYAGRLDGRGFTKVVEFTGPNGENPRGLLYIPDTTTIGTLPQTITFGNLVKTYGDSSFDGGAVASSGLPVTYTSSDTSIAVIDSNRIRIKGAGTAFITAYQSGNSVYAAATPVTDTLTVNKAPLIIKADSITIPYKAPIPPLTVSYSGFVYGENSSVLLVQPTVTSMAPTPVPDPGTYSISASGAVARNYEITYLPGALVVEPTCDCLSAWISAPGTLSVDIQSDKAQVVELEIFNTGGQRVLRKRLSLQEGFNHFEIPVGNLRPGVYFILVVGRKLLLTKSIRIN